MNEVNSEYVNTYFSTRDEIVTRCKDIASMMHNNSTKHTFHPEEFSWHEEVISTQEGTVTLELTYYPTYSEFSEIEAYIIPLDYFDMSNADILRDIRNLEKASKEDKHKQALLELRATATRLGCKVEELPK